MFRSGGLWASIRWEWPSCRADWLEISERPLEAGAIESEAFPVNQCSHPPSIALLSLSFPCALNACSLASPAQPGRRASSPYPRPLRSRSQVLPPCPPAQQQHHTQFLDFLYFLALTNHGPNAFVSLSCYFQAQLDSGLTLSFLFLPRFRCSISPSCLGLCYYHAQRRRRRCR